MIKTYETSGELALSIAAAPFAEGKAQEFFIEHLALHIFYEIDEIVLSNLDEDIQPSHLTFGAAIAQLDLDDRGIMILIRKGVDVSSLIPRDLWVAWSTMIAMEINQNREGNMPG